MAHRIELECVSCAICAEICPEKCIVEDADVFVIDAEACTDCGDCAPVCPIDCIVGERVSEGVATIAGWLYTAGSAPDRPDRLPTSDRSPSPS